MRIWSLYRLVSAAVAAFILAFVLWMAPAGAQERAPVNNPGAQGVSEQQLLDELGKIQGRVTIPDRKATTLQQPQGRDYQTFERTALPWVGAFIIIGTLLSIALFYLIRGRIRTRQANQVKKFSGSTALERLPPLDNRNSLHRPRDHRFELDLRKAPVDAADRAEAF